MTTIKSSDFGLHSNKILLKLLIQILVKLFSKNMFKPSVTPKVIPGPPVYDANHAAITGESATNQSGVTQLTSAVQTIIGANMGQSKNTVSITNLFSENINKSKRFPNRADWGENNLVAYCCQNYVVIVDPTSVQVRSKITALTR